MGTAAPVKTDNDQVFYINLEPGVDTGEVVELPNGQSTRIRVNMPDKYERRGLDLHYKVELTLKQALCGFHHSVPHPRGCPVDITVCEGQIVHPGATYRCPGLGMRRGEHFGDLVLEFTVKFPSQLSSESARAIADLLTS